MNCCEVVTNYFVKVDEKPSNAGYGPCNSSGYELTIAQDNGPRSNSNVDDFMRSKHCDYIEKICRTLKCLMEVGRRSPMNEARHVTLFEPYLIFVIAHFQVLVQTQISDML